MTTTKTTKTATKTTKTVQFDRETATLTEVNRELKRLASRKCRAKDVKARKEATKAYEELAAFKAQKFQTSRPSYYTMAEADIKAMDLETTIKAIKSLQSKRCLYPEQAADVLKVEAVYQAHKQELLERAKLEELMAKYNG